MFHRRALNCWNDLPNTGIIRFKYSVCLDSLTLDPSSSSLCIFVVRVILRYCTCFFLFGTVAKRRFNLSFLVSCQVQQDIITKLGPTTKYNKSHLLCSSDYGPLCLIQINGWLIDCISALWINKFIH